MTPFSRNTVCPRPISAPVKSTRPVGSTIFFGIGCSTYVLYARNPRIVKPTTTTRIAAYHQLSGTKRFRFASCSIP